MRQYAARRLFLFIPTILLTTMIVFALFFLVPGDAALFILTGEDGSGAVTEKDLVKLRHQLGLDRPIHVQYGAWLWGTVRGDLGDSIWYKTPVIDELKDKFAVTLELAVMGILMAFVVAVPLGVISAVKQDHWPDYVSRIISLIGIALPTFWLAILMVYFLAYVFNWLPPLGYATFWEDPLLNLQQLAFPAMAIAFHDLAFTARVTRSSMLEVLREDYVRTARSKGLAELTVIGRHALKNAILPIVTVSGYQFARLLGGVIIVETIFVVPGLGRFLIESIIHRDFVVIQAVILLAAAVVLSLNLIIDLFYGVLDPRIRYQ
ncbi:MAG TPA: ABC transporter permease [Dehalococcoidia bacterium]|nr:ABC transporter permease [Dehalococcoidia bacterium]